MSTTRTKNMNKSVSEIFKRTRSGKPYAEEGSHIEGYVNPNICDTYKLTKNSSSVDYVDILLPITEICRVKNKYCPFRYWHSGKI